MPHDVAIPVDDFRPRDADGAPPDSSRLDTPRSLLGDGLIFQESSLYVDADGGSGGASVELGPPSRPGEGLDPERLLGPYIKDGWQPRLVGVRLEIEGGYGEVEVQLLDEAGGVLWSATADADRRASAVDFAVELPGGAAAHRLQWFLHEGGYGEVKEVALLAETPDYADEVERSFLYSYGLLSRAWDPERGLVAFRNLWPASDYAAVEGPGLFALATAVAWDLGYVASSDARAVAEAARATYLDLEADPETGLFPRHLAGGGLHPDSYYSSLHTALGLEAAILAGEATGLDTRELTQRLEAIDWSALTDAYEDPISAGVDPAGEPVGWDFGTFGSDAAILGVAFAAVGEDAQPPMGLPYAPTWDGAGYNDELAALLFPMSAIDAWANSWQGYRESAFWKQFNYFVEHDYGAMGLFGLSTADTPEPWLADEGVTSGDWGVGGHNQWGNDGSAYTGYPIVTPRYAAMVVAEHPWEAGGVLSYVLDAEALTPLTAVESFGVEGGSLRWSHAQYSYHLAMMTLGCGRALSGSDYLPYRALESSEWLLAAFERSLTRE